MRPRRTAAPVERPALRKRRPERPEQIRRVALDLFRERGFHATTMVEIGECLGISGPALYRHFANKEEILCSAIEQHLAELTEATQTIMSAVPDPQRALEELVAASVRHALDGPELALAVMREQPLLSAKTRSFLNRVERHVVEDWVHLITGIRTDLSDAEIRMLVRGVMAMVMWSVQYDAGLPREQIERRLTRMALGAILESVDGRIRRKG